jgi:hypothetical protein
MRGGNATMVLVAVLGVVGMGLAAIVTLELSQSSVDRGLLTSIIGIITVTVPALLAYLKSDTAAAASAANGAAIARVDRKADAAAAKADVAAVAAVAAADKTAEVRQELQTNTALTAATAELAGVNVNHVAAAVRRDVTGEGGS